MKRVTRRRLLAVTLCVGVGVGACDERPGDVAGPSPTLQPTLSSIQREIFNTTDPSGRLACIQCHSDNGRIAEAGLVLLEGRSHAALVQQPSRFSPGSILVIPGDPDNSYLIAKLEGRPGIVGARMPRTNGPFLTDDQIRVLREWIERGANND